MSAYNREVILSRTVISDETGLLAAIPFPVFYKYSHPLKGTIDLEVELFNPAEGISASLSFGLVDKAFILLDAAGNCLGRETDFPVITTGKQESDGRKYVFGLHVAVDEANQSLKFFDSYYCMQADTDCEVFNGVKYRFVPCCLSGVNAGFLEDVPSPAEPPENPCTQLVIDRYTGVITGLVSKDDVLFTKHNQIVLYNNDLTPYREELGGSLQNLILQYRYQDGILLPVDRNDPRFKALRRLKSHMEELRCLQIGTSRWAVEQMLYENFSSYRQVRRVLRKKKRRIRELTEQICRVQDQIRREKIRNYKRNRLAYLAGHSYPYYASVCLLIKDENAYLEEWLRHYESMGIDHFYIYDNKSRTPVRDTIHAIDGGRFDSMCTVTPFTEYHKNMQYECYEHCLSHHGTESRWIGFFDTDEFVDVGQNIPAFLRQFEDDFCVWLPWELYNANGHINRRDATMKEAFPTPCPDPYGLWGKVFLQPCRTQFMYVHLGVGLDECEQVVNPDHSNHLASYHDLYMESRKGPLGLYRYGRIRHYITRSFEEWTAKMKRGTSDPNFKRQFDNFFAYNPGLAYLKEDPDVLKLMNTRQGYS